MGRKGAHHSEVRNPFLDEGTTVQKAVNFYWKFLQLHRGPKNPLLATEIFWPREIKMETRSSRRDRKLWPRSAWTHIFQINMERARNSFEVFKLKKIPEFLFIQQNGLRVLASKFSWFEFVMCDWVYGFQIQHQVLSLLFWHLKPRGWCDSLHATDAWYQNGEKSDCLQPKQVMVRSCRAQPQHSRAVGSLGQLNLFHCGSAIENISTNTNKELWKNTSND